MVNFDDLQFNKKPYGVSQVLIFFNNGYGASIIQGGMAYTSSDDEYELAVLEGNKDDWDLCYTTPITDDVIGHLTKDEVTEYLNKIENLEQDNDR